MTNPADSTEILLQFVTIQRDQPPTGRRVLTDGRLERTAPDNPLPAPTDLLERDRVLSWQPARTLGPESLQAIKTAVHESGFFNLQPKLLINYCKEDPGVTIWTVNIDGQQARVVVYDPKPKRSPEIDKLLAALTAVLGE